MTFTITDVCAGPLPLTWYVILHYIKQGNQKIWSVELCTLSGGLPATPNSSRNINKGCDSTPKLKLILMRVSVPTTLIKSLVCKHFTHAATGYHLKDVPSTTSKQHHTPLKYLPRTKPKRLFLFPESYLWMGNRSSGKLPKSKSSFFPFRTPPEALRHWMRASQAARAPKAVVCAT